RTLGDVLGAGDAGANACDPAEQEQVGIAPVLGDCPAKGGGAPQDHGLQPHGDREDRGLAQEQHVEEKRADRLNNHEVWLRKRRTVSREVIAVSAAITGTTAPMPSMPSMPSEKRPKRTP